MGGIVLGSTFDWAWTVVLGLVALPLISLVVQSHWSATAKRVTVVAVSAVLAVLYLLASGKIDGVPPDAVAQLVRWFVIFAGIVVVTQAIYNMVKGPLAKWESVTDITPAPVEVPDEDPDATAEPDPAEGEEDPPVEDDPANG
ncbi:MAG: hypothetical protein CVT66_06320 [Actinobacteria bacterium HGW-Actinobacteria-6]|nr:MAG: hypothetical protein CVT66_06320 [Actinobacteria bacterium HGW-Actinobacteria-6]